MIFKYSMEELVPIVADLSVKYTSGESASVTYDKAKQLMGAVQYAILIYQKETAALNGIATKDKIPARTAYEKGYELLCEKVKQVQEQYNQMIPHFLSFHNENYEATVVQGIPAFFKYYNPKFAPADTIIIMDYPVAGGVRYHQGILAIEEYMKKITLEQTFFSGLNTEYCYQVLESQKEGYREQFYNICGVILKDILMRMTLQEMSREDNGCDCSLQEYSKKELTEKFMQNLHLMIQEKQEENQELEDYLRLFIADFVGEILREE